VLIYGRMKVIDRNFHFSGGTAIILASVTQNVPFTFSVSMLTRVWFNLGSVVHLENSDGTWSVVTEFTGLVHNVISVVLACP
jgi:hypothetical protein